MTDRSTRSKEGGPHPPGRRKSGSWFAAIVDCRNHGVSPRCYVNPDGSHVDYGRCRCAAGYVASCPVTTHEILAHTSRRRARAEPRVKATGAVAAKPLVRPHAEPGKPAPAPNGKATAERVWPGEADAASWTLAPGGSSAETSAGASAAG